MVDLHMHSIASDGTFTPSQLVEEAKKNGLKAIAITDHDTIEGLDEGIKRGKELGLEVINGIEFSTEYQGREVHILGYMFDKNNIKLLAKLEELRLERETRTKIILEKLAKYKLYISMDELMEEVEGNLISRTHIANVMLKKGYVYSRNEAFKRYLKTNGIAYVPKESLDPFEAIKLINESGGIASLAHPKLIDLDRGNFEILLRQLIEKGLDAIEAYYPSFTLEDERYYLNLVKKLNLLATAGSDFHGLNRPNNNIGVRTLGEKEFLLLKERCKY